MAILSNLIPKNQLEKRCSDFLDFIHGLLDQTPTDFTLGLLHSPDSDLKIERYPLLISGPLPVLPLVGNP